MTYVKTLGGLALAAAVTLVAIPVTATAGGQPVVVKLDAFERGGWQQSATEWHPVCMALGLGTMLRQAKPKPRVTLFLNLGAVFLADASESLADKRCGGMGSVETMWAGFLDAGGSVMVCPGCAAVAGLSPSQFREGAAMGTMEDVQKLFVKAAKVIDY